MRRQLAEDGSGVFFLLLQLGESVFQLTKHVESYQMPKHRFLIYQITEFHYDLILRISHRPDDVFVSSLVGTRATLITGCRKRDYLLFPHQFQPLVKGPHVLFLS